MAEGGPSHVALARCDNLPAQPATGGYNEIAAGAITSGAHQVKRSVRTMAMVAGVMSWVLASPARSASYSSEATITVTGGPHAGVHTLKVEEVGCELRKRPNKPRYFNDNFGLPGVKDPKKLSFVLVNIRNVDGPGSPAPADFDASVTFGPVMGSGSTYYMSGTNSTTGRVGGPGKLLLKEDGTSAQVTLDLQPQEGITVTGTVKCTIIKAP